MKCDHPYPEEFGASEVSWNDSGLVGRVSLPCGLCGEIRFWTVTS